MRYFLTIFNQSVAQMLAYRTTSIFIVVFGTIFAITEIIATLIFYQYTDHIAGWNMYEFLLLIATFSFIQYIYQFFFVLPHEQLIDDMIDGNLDYLLIRPMDAQLIANVKTFDIPSLFNLIIPIALSIYCMTKLKWEITIFQIGGYLILLVFGVMSYFILNHFFVNVGFWIERSHQLMGVPEYLFEIGLRPRSVYPKVIFFIFVYVIPILLATNSPVDLLRGELRFQSLFYFILYNLLGFMLIRIQWKRGLKRYTSAN